MAPAGVVCLESTHPAAKRAAAGYLIRALGLARDLNRDLEQRAEELRITGIDSGVTVDELATLVMVEGAIRSARTGRRVNLADLLDEAYEHALATEQRPELRAALAAWPSVHEVVA